MRKNYTKLLPNATWHQLLPLLEQKDRWIAQPKKGFIRYQKPLKEIGHLRASQCDFSQDTVEIGKKEDLSPQEYNQVLQHLKNLMPWRKGPFSVFNIHIDSEWQSGRKWNRIVPFLPKLQGTIVADIGSNNGYYMFRLAHYQPELVLGFEPYLHHYFTFKTLNSFADQQNLAAELLGIEHLDLFSDCFDVIFCMGILYHRPSPIESLRTLYNALKQKGTLILESQVIPGDESIALFPEQTYAKVPGTWFVPTSRCLENWLHRTGFKNITLFCQHPMNSQEQRRTEWMTYESYEDFIDKNNPELTIEGYPAPHRVFFTVSK
jgi:tRNA (mo5U34)-methyltransferase